MADDTNSSNKPPMNRVTDYIDQSSFLTQATRVAEKHQQIPEKQLKVESVIAQNNELVRGLREQAKTNPSLKSDPFHQQNLADLREDTRVQREKVENWNTAARSRAQSETATLVAKSFTPTAINSQVASAATNTQTQTVAMTMAAMAPEQLENEHNRIQSDFRARHRQAQRQVKGMHTGRAQVNMDAATAVDDILTGDESQADFQKLAAIKQAKAFQRSSGKDPDSRNRFLGGMVQEAESIVSATKVAQEARSSNLSLKNGVDADGKEVSKKISTQNIDQELVTQASALKTAFEQLGRTTESEKEARSKLNKQINDSADNMKKLKEAQGQQGPSGLAMTGLVANGLASGFNALGAGAQQVLVNQRMQQISNIGGAAGYANQQYDMYTKARGGDIASQLALTKTRDADDFGQEMRNGTKTAIGLYGAGSLAQTAAHTAQGIEAGGQKVNVLSYATGASTSNTQALIQAGVGVTQGLVTTAATGLDFKRGSSADAAKVAGMQNNLNAQMALQQVGAKQMQGLRDFHTDLDVTSQSMGSNSSAFIKDATSADNMEMMNKARLSPQQFAQLSSQASTSIGSTFNKDQVYGARNLEQRGFGSAQENIQRMATLAGAGSNNPKEGMESVLAAAVSKGLDSSKSINMMVDNTASMVSSSAGAAVGIDTTAAASSMLANSINPEMKNKEFALQQAASAADITNAATTDRSVSFTGMANTAGLQMNLKNKAGVDIDLFKAGTLQGMDIGTLKSLQGKPNEAAKYFQNQGLGAINDKNSEKALQVILDEKQRSLLRPGGLGFGFDLDHLKNTINNGGAKPGSKEFDQLGDIANAQRRNGGAGEMIREMKGITAANVDAKPGQNLMSVQGDPKDEKSKTDVLRTSGFKQLTDAAQTAATGLEKFGGAMKVFNELQEKFEKDGKKNEEVFSDAAAKMATSFDGVAKDFGRATSTYLSASTAMMMAAKALASNRGPLPKEFTDLLETRKGAK